jgi:prepilin-type N-terminal cleavage/methylation domain-containing protein
MRRDSDTPHGPGARYGRDPPIGGYRGFPLVELLVVMLIISPLAAIAVPAFFTQREKALDAEAKASVAAAQRAIETRAVDAAGSYSGTDAASLIQIEATLATADLSVPASADRSYTLRVRSRSGRDFELSRNPGGDLSRICGPAGGGCDGGSW